MAISKYGASLSVPFNNLSSHCQIKAPNYIEACIDQITLVCVPPSVNTILNYIVTLSILIMPWFAFAQINPPAHNGTYDPEFRSLYDHLEKTLISPKASVGDDINGIVYVRFLLNDKGFIIANSITTEGLSPAADLAVIRALKLFTKPLPFGRTDEHGERSCFIPVKFQFKESLGAQVPVRFLSAPLKTVILNKEVKAANPNWRVYAQTGLNGVLGEVAPGDSVTVTGWAAHAFFIQTGRLSGYISVIIQVRPAPFTAPKSFLPIGNLKVEESLTAANGLVAGQPFLYHFSISGNGVLLPIAPPRPKTDGIEIRSKALKIVTPFEVVPSIAERLLHIKFLHDLLELIACKMLSAFPTLIQLQVKWQNWFHRKYFRILYRDKPICMKGELPQLSLIHI